MINWDATFIDQLLVVMDAEISAAEERRDQEFDRMIKKAQAGG